MRTLPFAIALLFVPALSSAQSLAPDEDPRFRPHRPVVSSSNLQPLPPTILGGDISLCGPANSGVHAGPESYAQCAESTAIGDGAVAHLNSTAVGAEAFARGVQSTAIGTRAYASEQHSVAVGDHAHATGFASIATGHLSWASGQGASAYGWESEAHGQSATAVGHRSYADGNGALALGYRASATGEASTAVGERASATADNSVALGSNSVADEENTVSVGSTTNQRRITNVAAGVNPNDAVNRMQLDDLWGFARNGFNQVNHRIDVLSDRIDSIGAMSAAMSMMSAASYHAPGTSKVSVGVGSYNGESAFALGYSRPVGRRGSFSLGASTSGEGTMVGAGFSFALD